MNYGLLLRDTIENNTSQWTSFYSSDAASPNKPELVIVYSKNMYYTNVYLGISYTDTRLDGVCNAVAAAFASNGYTGKTYRYQHNPSNNINKTVLKNELKSAKVFSFITHGKQNGIRLPGDIWFEISDLATLSVSDLSSLKFVFFGACETGKGGNGASNLVNAMYAKGVDAVLGFRIMVDIDENDYWTQFFMTKIAAGYSITQAMSYADTQTRIATGIPINELTVGVNYRYLCGLGNYVPCPNY